MSWREEERGCGERRGERKSVQMCKHTCGHQHSGSPCKVQINTALWSQMLEGWHSALLKRKAHKTPLKMPLIGWRLSSKSTRLTQLPLLVHWVATRAAFPTAGKPPSTPWFCGLGYQWKTHFQQFPNSGSLCFSDSSRIPITWEYNSNADSDEAGVRSRSWKSAFLKSSNNVSLHSKPKSFSYFMLFYTRWQNL